MNLNDIVLFLNILPSQAEDSLGQYSLSRKTEQPQQKYAITRLRAHLTYSYSLEDFAVLKIWILLRSRTFVNILNHLVNKLYKFGNASRKKSVRMSIFFGRSKWWFLTQTLVKISWVCFSSLLKQSSSILQHSVLIPKIKIIEIDIDLDLA